MSCRKSMSRSCARTIFIAAIAGSPLVAGATPTTLVLTTGWGLTQDAVIQGGVGQSGADGESVSAPMGVSDFNPSWGTLISTSGQAAYVSSAEADLTGSGDFASTEHGMSGSFGVAGPPTIDWSYDLYSDGQTHASDNETGTIDLGGGSTGYGITTLNVELQVSVLCVSGPFAPLPDGWTAGTNATFGGLWSVTYVYEPAVPAPNPPPPVSTTDVGSGQLLSLDGLPTIDSELVNNEGSLTVNGTGAIIQPTAGTTLTNNGTFSYTGGTVSITALVGTGSATIGEGKALNVNELAQGALAVEGKVTVADRSTTGSNHPVRLNTLTINESTGGALDLNDNDLVVENGVFSDIQNLVFDGYRDHVDSSATGITSSTSQANGGETMLMLFNNALAGMTEWPPASGNSIGANAIVGKYTYRGDTNLDGQITVADYSAIDSNLGTTGLDPGIAIFYGDTNFDQSITIGDYNWVDAGMGRGVGNPLAIASVIAVPEPLGLSMVALLGGGLLLRRRRRN